MATTSRGGVRNGNNLSWWCTQWQQPLMVEYAMATSRGGARNDNLSWWCTRWQPLVVVYAMTTTSHGGVRNDNLSRCFLTNVCLFTHLCLPHYYKCFSIKTNSTKNLHQTKISKTTDEVSNKNNPKVEKSFCLHFLRANVAMYIFIVLLGSEKPNFVKKL